MSRPLCPSFAAVPGALLLGRLADDGTVRLLHAPLPVDESFLTALVQRHVDADAAYRFAGPCQQGGCSRWADGSCQVASRGSDLVAEQGVPLLDALPDCGIREACRWFGQEGTVACTACVFIARRPATAAA